MTLSEKHKYVKILFSRISYRYDFMNSMMTLGLHNKWRRIAAVLASDSPIGKALDVATGTGDMAFELAAFENFNEIIGVDFVPEMIQLAKQKNTKLKVSKKMKFLEADAEALPFNDNEFICVTSSFNLRNVSDLKLALSEMIRVLKTGGKFITLDILLLDNIFLRTFFRLYFNFIVPILGALFVRDRAAYTYLPSSVDAFLTPDELSKILKELGLRNVGYKALWLGTPVIHFGEK